MEHRYYWPFGKIYRKLDQVLEVLQRMTEEEHQMAGELDALTAAVQAETTEEGSVIALLTGIKAQLDAAIANGNPAALVALSTQIQANTTAMAAAVVANTPAAPAA